MDNVDLQTSLWGWWLLIPALLFVALIGGVIWRRWRLSSILGIFSLLLMSLTLLIWPLSWRDLYDVVIGWNRPQPSGATHVWSLRMLSQRGGVQLGLQAVKGKTPADVGRPTAWPAEIHLRSTHERPDDVIPYPNYDREGDRNNIIRWKFLNETVGFHICWGSYPDRGVGVAVIRAYAITVPHWFVLLLCLPFPLIWLRFHRRARSARRQVAQGLCAKCGFDLRASIEKCPECGTLIPTSAKNAAAESQASST